VNPAVNVFHAERNKADACLLDDIIEGRATEETLEILEDLALMVQKGSLCGLGKTRQIPFSQLSGSSATSIWPCKERNCPAGKCKGLIRFAI
jgi:NADH-quinone oxidoreductase subunit F